MINLNKKKNNQFSKIKYKNKQRTLVFSTYKTTKRLRHLIKDLRNLLPHSKKESKLDGKHNLHLINEICEMNSCNNCLFFESRKSIFYLWITRIPTGPSIRFLITNIHTMRELKLTGNCIKGTRPLLVFDESFDFILRLKIVKEMLSQTFGSPYGHPKIKPFIDHVFSFFYLDQRVWFRNFQLNFDSIINKKNKSKPILIEIGPRMVLQPLKMLSGSFSGRIFWINKKFLISQKV